MPNTIPFNQIKPYVEECLPGWVVYVWIDALEHFSVARITIKSAGYCCDKYSTFIDGVSETRTGDLAIEVSLLDKTITALILWTETLENA